MKKYIYILLAFSFAYLAIYIVNIMLVFMNYSALLIGRSPSLSFGAQVSFAGWGLPLAVVIVLAAFLMNAAYTAAEKK